MPWRIAVREFGDADVLKREEIHLPDPGPGEVRLRIEASGLNYIDTYHRSGLYPVQLPSGLGVEAAGRIEAIGPGVEGWTAGDRVGCLPLAPGSYATHMLCNASRLIALPLAISSEIAAAVMLKGFTAWMLIERCARVQPGQIVLVHAAAGGVGTLLVPWLKRVGAIVIAHTGTQAKAAAAKGMGADHALWGPLAPLAAEIRSLTGGHGADVILDGVGQASWAASLGAVAKRGLIVSYGNASGPVPPVPPLDLQKAGSVFLTRPRMYDYADTPEAMEMAAARLFGLIIDDTLKVRVDQQFALADAAKAHHALEGRLTTGSTILIP